MHLICRFLRIPCKRDTMTPTNSTLNSIADTPELNVNKIHHIQAVILTPTIFVSNSDVHAPEFNENPANIYMLNVNNRNARKRCEIYSELTIKTPERRH